MAWSCSETLRPGFWHKDLWLIYGSSRLKIGDSISHSQDVPVCPHSQKGHLARFTTTRSKLHCGTKQSRCLHDCHRLLKNAFDGCASAYLDLLILQIISKAWIIVPWWRTLPQLVLCGLTQTDPDRSNRGLTVKRPFPKNFFFILRNYKMLIHRFCLIVDSARKRMSIFLKLVL